MRWVGPFSSVRRPCGTQRGVHGILARPRGQVSAHVSARGRRRKVVPRGHAPAPDARPSTCGRLWRLGVCLCDLCRQAWTPRGYLKGRSPVSLLYTSLKDKALSFAYSTSGALLASNLLAALLVHAFNLKTLPSPVAVPLQSIATGRVK